MDSHDTEPGAPARGAAELERRVLQLDEAVARVRQVQQRLEQSEESFRRLMTDRSSLLQGVLTIDQLVELNGRLSQLLDDSAQRMEQFEDRLNREWSQLRERYEAPLRDFREHANELRQASLEAARSAALTRQIAEASYATLAARAPAGASLAHTGPIEPWSLDDVTRVHQEVRAQQGFAADSADDHGAASTFDAFSVGAPAPRRGRRRTLLWATAFALILLATAAGTIAYTMQLRERMTAMDSRMEAAAQRLADAERRSAEARQQANDQFRDAQRTAQRAQTIADIVAAPDVRRIALIGRSQANGAYGQALASQLRGLLVNASRLPAIPDGKAYHVWALARGEAINLGVLSPDGDGRSSLLIDRPLGATRISSIIVSLESGESAAAPTGAIYLAPPPPAQPQE